MVSLKADCKVWTTAQPYWKNLRFI